MEPVVARAFEGRYAWAIPMRFRFQGVLASAACVCLLSGCGLPPIALVTHGAAATYVATRYQAFGDSITYGLAVTDRSKDSYVALVAADRGWTVANHGIPGAKACDVFPMEILPERVAFTGGPGQVYSLMIGTNDADGYGVGLHEEIFEECQLAAITWLGTQPEDKVLPGDASVKAAGGCLNVATADGFTCSGPGSLTFGGFSTTGPAVYVWYEISDTAAEGASFTASVDGVASTRFAKPGVRVETVSPTNASVGVLRLVPGAAGVHEVRISTATGGVKILAVGTNRAVRPVVVAVGEVPNQLLGHSVASVATQLAYSADVRQNVALAVSDGLDVRLVEDRRFMNGTSAEMDDPLHPNRLGHQYLSYAFLSALP